MFKKVFSVILMLIFCVNISIDAYADENDDINKCIEELTKIRSDQSSWSDDMKKAQAENFSLIVTALRADGYSDAAISGIVCNMMFESRLDPYCGEGNYQYFSNRGDEDYELSVAGNGIGLGQWTYGRRLTFSDYCKDSGKAVKCTQSFASSSSSGRDNNITYVGDAPTQIAFLISENTWNHNENRLALPSLDNGLEDFKKLDDAELATKYYCICWEVPADMTSKANERASLSKDMYSFISGGSVDFGKSVNNNAAQEMVNQLALSGFWDEARFASFSELVETPLTFPDKDQLSKDQLKGVTDWKNNIEYEEDDGLIKWLRVIIMLFGIVFLVWVLLIYLSYWFDRINNFLDLELLPIVTAGRLRVSPEEHECTFNPKNSSKGQAQTVNHRTVLILCGIGIFFSVLVISGKFYTILNSVVRKILETLGVA